MPVSLLLAQEIAKLFLILLLGVAVVRAGLLHAADSRVLSVILVYLIVPCVILNAFQIEDTPELRAGLLFALGAAVLAPRVGLAGVAWACAFGWCVMLLFEAPYYFYTCKKMQLR